MAETELTRILYVEDEPDIQAVAQIALEAVGGADFEGPSLGGRVLEGRHDLVPKAVGLGIEWRDHADAAAVADLGQPLQLRNNRINLGGAPAATAWCAARIVGRVGPPDPVDRTVAGRNR